MLPSAAWGADVEAPLSEGPVRADVVEITPGEGASVMVGGNRHGGTIRVSGHGSGLAIVEVVDLDSYLAGIQEVPFSWEPAALEAQAIAARSYLAWTLSQGRTDAGSRYDYDICATVACQVYAGLEPSLAEGGEKWLEAVDATSSQILLFEGSPALTYYSSTTGGRTFDVTDIWPESEPFPYLQGAESPGEDSPFARWSWRLPAPQMGRLLVEAGMATGTVTGVTTERTEDGEGPWTVTVQSDGGEETATTWDLRSMLNRAGPAALGDYLPAKRPDGPLYPQTILSPRYLIDSVPVPLLVPGGPRMTEIYVVDGHGWGHLVGMSQYGAQAMAEEGATAADILAHYYGGLRPEEAPDLVPETVEVALATEEGGMELEASGPVSVTVDGRRVAGDELGSWSLSADRGSVVVEAPVGLGLPPVLRPGGVGFAGGRLVLRPEVTAAAEVTWAVTVDGVTVATRGPETVDAGFLTIPFPVVGGDIELTITAANAHGSTTLVVGD